MIDWYFQPAPSFWDAMVQSESPDWTVYSQVVPVVAPRMREVLFCDMRTEGMFLSGLGKTESVCVGEFL